MQLYSIIKGYKTHFLVWVSFIAYEVLVVGLVTGSFGSLLDYSVHYILNILLFYLFATVILPRTLLGTAKPVLVLPFLVFLVLACYVFVVYGAELLLTRYLGVTMLRPVALDYNYILRSTWRAIYFMGFATGYYFLIKSLKEKLRAEQAERQHLLQIIEKQTLQHELIKSQNAFLKAQINPHFLFNTLSFVYNSVRKTSAQAAETILSLSEMMRYSLQREEEHMEADLLKEIEQVEHLIRIYQLRNDHKLHIELVYSPNLAGVRFIPLVLLTLVENIFKHGNLTQKGQGAIINVLLDEEGLQIRTSNLRCSTRPSGHRIGLDNIRRRLRHSYQDNFLLESRSDKKGYFHTFLQVPSALVTAAADHVGPGTWERQATGPALPRSLHAS
ncbi:histidine kinase [Pontibacter sp. Tf4]|uniref:sensor histidine kinase n=1 Tax=Pontibacter sp. Tf4 TaxID=2761620 RepID=UPI00162A5442|nr:histidine kinase [Pontibacter sp. Tf4]MBB6611767.1 histidine kinase [Pontibacter sp. Tf4]